MLSTIGLVASLAILAALAWLLAIAHRGTAVHDAPHGVVVDARCLCFVGGTAAVILFGRSSPEVQSQSLYWTAIASLCPGIAVLGAKRPGSRVWNLFIVVPLVLVLGWPAVTVWRADGPRLFTAEWPVLGGLLLVLIMGTGNYLGTRFAGAAALYSAATLVLVAPASVAMTHSRADLAGATHWMFLAATLLLGTAAWLAWRASRTGTASGITGTARLWNDFRETFGIVWGTRLRERLLQEAHREKWPASAIPGIEGLEYAEGATAEDRRQAEARYRHHLLWLLRRFVDPEWIEARMKAEGPETGSRSDT